MIFTQNTCFIYHRWNHKNVISPNFLIFLSFANLGNCKSIVDNSVYKVNFKLTIRSLYTIILWFNFNSLKYFIYLEYVFFCRIFYSQSNIVNLQNLIHNFFLVLCKISTLRGTLSIVFLTCIISRKGLHS